MPRRLQVSRLGAMLLRSAVLFAVCFWTGRMAMALGASEHYAALIWLPTGVSLAAVMLYGYGLWPAVFLAALFVQLGNNLPLFTAVGVGVGNTLEAVVGVWLLRHFQLRPSLSRLRDVLVLILAGAVVSTLLSAVIGMFSLYLGGAAPAKDVLRRGVNWWLINAVSDLIVAPVLLVWGSADWPKRRPWAHRPLEVFGFLAAAALTFGTIYKGWFFTPDGPYRIFEPYLLAPVLVWAALRFGQHGTTFTVLLVATFGALVSLHGNGPLSDSTTMNNLIYVEFLTTIAAIAAMVLAAAIDEQADALSCLRESEQQLRLAKDEAEAGNRAKSLFLAKVSHEIRTPLGAMLGFTDFLLEPGFSSDERHGFIETIKRNGQLLARIIDDILDLSKVEADRLDLEAVDCCLPALLTDINALLSFKAVDKGLKFSITADGRIPQTITTDPTRLRQVLINVIGNAVKFTSKGAVEVSIRLLVPPGELATQAGVKSGPRYLEFQIIDSGPGLTPQQAKKLFQPFSQADNSTTRRYGGTGLGLFLAQKLAVVLGGSLRLQTSEPGLGSLFVFRLPVLERQCRELVDYPEPTPEVVVTAPAQVVAATPLTKIRILLVDDSPDNRALIGRLLSHAGGDVELAVGGLDGVEKAATNRHDVILMDIQMPEVDGYAAMSQLRQGGYVKPIIALTAHAMKEERERAMREGFDDFLTKPVMRDMMIATVVRWAHQGDLRSAGP